MAGKKHAFTFGVVRFITRQCPLGVLSFFRMIPSFTPGRPLKLLDTHSIALSVFRFLLFTVLPLAIVSRPLWARDSLPSVTIRQLHEVVQGGSGWFEVNMDPEEKHLPLTLRLTCDVGVGAAAFEDGSTVLLLKRSKNIQVRGLIATDVPGAITISGWLEGAYTPVATLFFDVLAANPEPRIFYKGRDVTGDTLNVAVGQQIRLNVFLHPGLLIRSQSWSIGTSGDHTGGFLHTPLQGGPQPVVLEGPSTLFYWLTPGLGREVIYKLTLADGAIASAMVKFDIEGPFSTDVEVDVVRVVVAPSAVPNSSVLGLAGSGITFHARSYLPEGMLENFTWVQLVHSDYLEVRTKEDTLECTPQSQPFGELSPGLDTSYPYDTRNPTRDNPPLPLTSEAQEFSRSFHARMYLLWSSGLSNSIAVPLGYVDWHFSAQAVLRDAATNNWVLKYGRGGPDDPGKPFTRSQSYPQWSSMVPYTGILTCN